MIDYIIVNITCNICLRHGKSISSDWESCCQSGFWVMWLNKMIEFFFPNSRALLTTFHINCPDICHFAQIGSHFAQNTTPNSIVTHPFLGDMYIHTTPPSPSKNTHFPALNFKVGKMNYSLGNLDPNWATCLKSQKTFSRSGQKKLVHLNQEYRWESVGCWLHHVPRHWWIQVVSQDWVCDEIQVAGIGTANLLNRPVESVMTWRQVYLEQLQDG